MQDLVNQGGRRGLATRPGNADDATGAGEEEEGNFHLDLRPMLLSQQQIGRGARYTRVTKHYLRPAKILFAMLPQHKLYWQTRSACTLGASTSSDFISVTRTSAPC